MAYQQFQVACPASQWTQLTEYRPGRKSLLVQCPQAAMIQASGSVNIPGNAATAILAADPFRKTLVMAVTAENRNAYVWIDNTVSGNIGKALDNSSAANIWDLQADASGPYGQWVQSAWWGIEPAGLGAVVNYLTTSYSCAGIILATAKNPAAAGGPYGSAPPGNWLSPDLSDGPANFRLQEPLDGEQTIQAWYAWPVGSATVSVTVSEAWDIMQPPETPKKFSVVLPRLSDDAIAALNELLGKMSQYDEQEAAEGG